ncbi:MAG: patatin-like phospholipase family protein [Planctomycetota bacterium]
MVGGPSSSASGSSGENDLALVMTGGGARAAYQVGLLRWLGRHFPGLRVPILTGVSAGAINAVHLACRPGSFRARAEELAILWAGLDLEKVFRVDTLSMLGGFLRWGTRLASGGERAAPRVRGLVDTSPLHETLEKGLRISAEGCLPGIGEKLERGALQAVAVTATSYGTGQSVTWVEGRSIGEWERAHRKSERTRLCVNHVMASAALPMVFPAVEVDGAWYGDGGIRLSAPLSPAVHLGAERILAISTRYARTRGEADQPVVAGYPPPATVAGVLLNAIFLDLLDADALRLERINQLVAKVPPQKRGDLRPVRLLVLRPSRDLGKLANEFESDLPFAFRTLTRGLGTRETHSNDLLSLLMFQPDYLKALLELGEADAEKEAGRLHAFLEEG